MEVHGDQGGRGDDVQGVADAQGLGVLEEEAAPPARYEGQLSPLLLYK